MGAVKTKNEKISVNGAKTPSPGGRWQGEARTCEGRYAELARKIYAIIF